MNFSFQPMFANGMVIMMTLVYVWIAAAILSGLLSLTALTLAIRRRAATALRVLAAIACAVGIIPVALVGLLFLGEGWPNKLFPFGVAGVSILPILVATAALLISRKHSRRAKAPSISPS